MPLASGLKADRGCDIARNIDLEPHALTHISSTNHPRVVEQVVDTPGTRAGFDAGRNTNAQQLATLACSVFEIGNAHVARHLQNFTQYCGVVATVVGSAGRNGVRKLVRLDKVPEADLGPV